MPRYKLLLIIIFVFLLFFFVISSAYQAGIIKIPLVNQEQPAPLPGWVTRAHRLSGPYASDFIPLDLDDLAKPDEEKREPDTATPADRPYVNPSGSPYPPGTLADMIWQQQQLDQRFGN